MATPGETAIPRRMKQFYQMVLRFDTGGYFETHSTWRKNQTDSEYVIGSR